MSIKPPLYEPIGAFCSLESASAAAQMSLAGGKVKPGWALAIFGTPEDGYELVQYPFERGEVSNLVDRLREHATDWDGTQMPDLEPAKGEPTAGTLRAAADLIEKLEKALREIAATDHYPEWAAYAHKALEG